MQSHSGCRWLVIRKPNRDSAGDAADQVEDEGRDAGEGGAEHDVEEGDGGGE